MAWSPTYAFAGPSLSIVRPGFGGTGHLPVVSFSPSVPPFQLQAVSTVEALPAAPGAVWTQVPLLPFQTTGTLPVNVVAPSTLTVPLTSLVELNPMKLAVRRTVGSPFSIVHSCLRVHVVRLRCRRQCEQGEEPEHRNQRRLECALHQKSSLP